MNNSNSNRGNMSTSTSTSTSSTRSGRDDSSAANGGSGAMMSAVDQKFVMDAAMGNNAEIMMGQMAVQKASSPEVKTFAQTMVDHHTAANAQLAQSAQAAGLTLPTGVAPNHQAVMDGMRRI